ncbi:MAG TPA: Gfo/Idh/MocA family oxidoreductase [Solirubrobacteraceae bacterium]
MQQADGAMAMPRTIGIGLVGVGWMGRLHAASYRRVADHFPECAGRPRLVIAADELEERAGVAVEQFGFEAATTDAYEVIAHPDVEAVSITGPNHVHKPVALACAAAGKHFWAEKPLGRFPSETLEIAAAARDAGIITTVGFNYRQAPAVQHAHRLIASGRIGEVRNYRGYFLVDYASDPDTALSWRFLRETAGLGVLGDLMSHVVDMALWLGGPIVDVCAQERIEVPSRPLQSAPATAHYAVNVGAPRGKVENEDYVGSLVRFDNGACGTLEVGRAILGHRCRMGFELHGAHGAIGWDFERMNELQLYLPGAGDSDTGYARVLAGPQHGDFHRFQPGPGIPMGYGDLKAIEAYVFLQSVGDGRHRAPSADDARDMARVLLAMQQSVEARGWQSVC